jgi:hypothetical protein
MCSTAQHCWKQKERRQTIDNISFPLFQRDAAIADRTGAILLIAHNVLYRTAALPHSIVGSRKNGDKLLTTSHFLYFNAMLCLPIGGRHIVDCP